MALGTPAPPEACPLGAGCTRPQLPRGPCLHASQFLLSSPVCGLGGVMELGLGHPQLLRELGQQGWGAPGVGVWTGLWPRGTLGGQGWRAAFWGIRAGVTPGWPEAQRAGGDWCPHPRSWTRGATGLYLQARQGGGTGGWSVSPEGRGGLGSHRRRCHHVARAAAGGGQRAVVPFSWCFSSCYETGHFPAHL